MVAPISNDKISASDSSSSSISEKKRADQGTAGSQSTSNEILSKEENSVETSSVDVERANQIYSQSTTKPLSDDDSITTPEQAKALASEIRFQIEQNGQEALNAQTGAASNSLSALLEAAPV